jgi:hypothetical protein
MSGRAIEGMCVHFKTKGKGTTFAGGLKELREAKIIDDRLFQWSEALREHRNLGGHAKPERISAQAA